MRPRPVKSVSIQKRLEEFRVESDKRSRVAQRAYDAQDRETKAAIDLMVDRFLIVSSGMVKMKFRDQEVATQLPEDVVRANALYVATEVMKDLAFHDIRIANYRIPPNSKPVKKRD